jgi:hydroxylamine reductase
MYCYQCQETAKNTGCTVKGVCGKTEDVANLQDLLIYALKGISLCIREGDAREGGSRKGPRENAAKGSKTAVRPERFIARSLFSTITNGNFDADRIIALIREGISTREELKREYGVKTTDKSHDCLTWNGRTDAELREKASSVGVLSTADEDVRSLRELLVYGVKGIAAYAEHAAVLGHEDEEIYRFIVDALASTVEDLPVGEMTSLVLKAGEIAVKTMALLDKANSTAYGNPEITRVRIDVGKNPGILVSGHDLKDIEELLEQTKNTGVDVYTHGEMLPAHYYPVFKKYSHLVGNYGGSWWKQDKEFETFGGPILMTTNCITPVKESYKGRIFTTGVAGYPGVKHIPEREPGKRKDFSEIVALAKRCPPPQQIESGEIVGGFAHEQVSQLAGKVVEAVKSGAVKKFVVMAGCDGRQKGRSYFTEVAEKLPENTIILTAGCAKYRYNKLELGDIGGIPRVLDAGQCNDSYSLALTALKLKEAFGLHDINDLPIAYDIAWYEQKAVAVLLALLSLGVKGIRLGPTLPAFLSPGVTKVLVEKFGIGGTGTPERDVAEMTGA